MTIKIKISITIILWGCLIGCDNLNSLLIVLPNLNTSMALTGRIGSLTSLNCRFGSFSRTILLDSQIEVRTANSKRFYAVKRTVAGKYFDCHCQQN